MAILEPLPKEVGDRLIKDIENTTINEDLINACVDILRELLKKKSDEQSKNKNM